MEEYLAQVKRTLLHTILWSVFVILNAFLTGKTHLVPSLALGCTASLIYFLLMSYRVTKSATMPPLKAVSYMRTGFGIRLVFVVMILILSAKIQWINFPAAVVGLFSLQIVLYLNAVTAAVRGIFFLR